ncbi:MAG: hypothetical protein LBR10_02640 [Prevotellaceae bacterium]|jgi:hypothetical protein|nr:hypothetical protein [Prevotellaceae bacterium]
MYNVSLVLYGYFVAVFACLFFYLLGHATLKYGLRISLPISARRTFAALLAGMVVCVVAYSVFKTVGCTANLLFVPLIGCYFWFKGGIIKDSPCYPPVNKQLHSLCVSRVSVCGFSFLVSALLYAMFCYANLDGDSHFRPVEGDDYSYGMLAQYLNRGFENIEYTKNFWIDCRHHPYHYFEVWLAAMLYKIFHLNSLWTFTFIVPTILHTVIFWGLMSIVERYRKLDIKTAGLCFILLFTTEISIVLSHLGQKLFPYPMQYCSGLILTKIAPVCLFFLAVILLLVYKKNKEALLVALAMPVVSFATTPLIFALTGYLILRDLLRNRQVKYEYLIPYGATLCLFACYVFSGEKHVGQTTFPSLNDLKLRLFITNPISFSLRYIFPIALILLIDFKRFYRFCKRYCIEILLFFGVSTSFSVLLRPFAPDAVQFTTVLYYGFFNIAFPAGILLFWKNDYSKLKTVFIALLFFVGYSLNVATITSFFHNNRRLASSSRLAYEDLVAKQYTNTNVRIGVIRHSDEVSDWSNYNAADGNLIATFLDSYYNDVVCYSLVKGTKGLSEETTFSLYLNKAKIDNPNLAYDVFQLDFIKMTEIGYIIVYQGGLVSDKLAEKLQLVANDPDSGECFYKIVNL